MNGIARKSTWGLVLATFCLMAVPAAAQSTFELIGEFYVHQVSADGNAASGFLSTGSREVCRWTPEDGVVPLGMSTVEILGGGAGRTGISDDGLRIAATIASLDSTVMVQGRWTKGVGWEMTMPPVPAGLDTVDLNLSSAYGLSGDGETVVGLVWTENARGRASAWTDDGGMQVLPPQFEDRSCRANGVNRDGSVVVGWTDGGVGPWHPTVWENGVMTVLSYTDTGNEAQGVNRAGNLIVGSTLDPITGRRPGALWTKTDTGWVETVLGALPGTVPYNGRCNALAISDDGSIIVGSNMFSTGYFGGFAWTLEQGLMRADDYLESLGIMLPADLNIYSLNDVSPNGRVIVGYGMLGDPLAGGYIVSFRVIRPPVSAVPDAPQAADLTLEPAYPNPFNPSTSLALVLERDAAVQLDVYDVRGHKVRTVHDGFLAAGRHVMEWDGRDDAGSAVASGIYLARARGAGEGSVTQRLTLLK